MTPEEFRLAGRQLVDLVADYLETIEARPVGPQVQPGDLRAQLPAHPPSEPESVDAVIADLQEAVARGRGDLRDAVPHDRKLLQDMTVVA